MTNNKKDFYGMTKEERKDFWNNMLQTVKIDRVISSSGILEVGKLPPYHKFGEFLEKSQLPPNKLNGLCEN